MPSATTEWSHTLTESVHALGAATREYRMATQAARTSSWSSEPTRLASQAGAVSVVGRDCIRPHDDAVWKLNSLHSELECRVKELYENSALAYAYGAAASVASVLNGERHHYVETGRRNGEYVLSSEPLPDLQEGLVDWIGGPNLVALREIVIEHMRAREVVRELSFYEDLANVESSDLTDATEFASGLADSAYAYGEQAERALHFVLIAAHVDRAAGESA